MSSVQNLPLQALPFLYISGMNISVASDTVMAIAPGQCRDQNDNIDIQVPNVQYLNSAVNGANGLDTGSLAASSNYLIWEIADSTGKLLPAGLISLQSNVGPLVPYGYDSMRLIGAVQTDGAAHFLAASVRNANYYKGFYLQPAVGVLSGGNATTFTAINLGTAIPTTTDTFVIALCTVTFIPAAANDIVQFRPTGSSSTANLPVITGVAAGVAQTQNIALNCGVGGGNPEVDYRVSVGGDSVSMSVYGYYVTLS